MIGQYSLCYTEQNADTTVKLRDDGRFIVNGSWLIDGELITRARLSNFASPIRLIRVIRG
jgi:hypothetical protein